MIYVTYLGVSLPAMAIAAVTAAATPQTTAPKGNRHRQLVIVICPVNLSIDPGDRRFLLSKFANANFRRRSSGCSFNSQPTVFADFKLHNYPKGQLPKGRREIIKMPGPKLGRSISKPQDFEDESLASTQVGDKRNFSIPLAWQRYAMGARCILRLPPVRHCGTTPRHQYRGMAFGRVRLLKIDLVKHNRETKNNNRYDFKRTPMAFTTPTPAPAPALF
jgi:hypothetical protein